MRRTKRFFPSHRAFNMGGVKTPRGIRLPLGGGVGVSVPPSYDDLVDSPDWDTFPVGGLPTNWSIQEGIYTLEGATDPEQAIVYRDFDFRDGEVSARLLNNFTATSSPDMFLSLRIVDTNNYIGARYTPNGLTLSEVVGGGYTNLVTLAVASGSLVTLRVDNDFIELLVNGSSVHTDTVSHIVSGRVGIIARNNASAVPLGVFSGFTATKYNPLPVFALDLSAPQGTTTRVGTQPFYWTGSQFAQATDGTTPIVSGQPVGPTQTVAGYTIQRIYPEWAEGDVLVAGQEVWLSHPTIGTKVVRAKEGVTLPREYLADLTKFDIVSDYEPWYGVYVQQRANNILADSCDISQWSAGGTMTVTPLAEEIVAGYPAHRITDSAADGLVNQFFGDVTNGTTYSCVGVCRPLDNAYKHINAGVAGNPGFYMNQGNVEHNHAFIGSTLTGSYYRYLQDGWIFFWFRWQQSGDQPARYLNMHATRDLIGSSMDVAFVCISDTTNQLFMPNPAVSQPAEQTQWIVGSTVDLWNDPRMDFQGHVLAGMRYQYSRSSDEPIEIGWIAPRNNYKTITATASARTHRSFDRTEAQINNANTSSTAAGQRVHSVSFVVGDKSSLFQSEPGRPNKEVSDTLNNSHDDDVNVRLVRGISQRVSVPVWLRYAAWWDEPDAFVPDEHFGPDTFINPT